MKSLEIKHLVERYYEGLSTSEEENRLYFHLLNSSEGEKYPEVLTQIKALRQLNTHAETDVDFEESLLAAIQPKRTNTRKSSWTFYRLSGIAAAVLLFFALWIGSELVKPTEVYGTINDPVKAFNETNRMLGRVSTEMNKGIVPVEQTSGKMMGGIKKVGATMQKADKSSEVNKASQYLKSFTRVYVHLGS